MTPTPPIVGGATRAEVALRDGAHRPVRGAKLQVEAHMSHPGMAAIVAPITERGDGVYEVQLPFTMAGNWMLIVTGTLPDGRVLNHRVDITTRPAG